MTTQPAAIDWPRVTCSDDFVSVTLDGVTLAAVEFAPVGERPSPIRLQASFLEQYSAAVSEVARVLLDEAAAQYARRAEAEESPEPIDPVAYVEEVDAKLADLANDDPFQGLDQKEFLNVMTQQSGRAQERCVRLVVDTQGGITSVAFGPTAKDAADLGTQLVRGYWRACADVRDAVAEQDPRMAARVCALVSFDDEED